MRAGPGSGARNLQTMNARLLHHSRQVRRWVAATAVRCWHEPMPWPRAASRGVVIPLSGSALIARLHRLLIGLHALYAFELLTLGHWFIGAIAASLLVAILFPRRTAHPSPAAVPRQLLMAADGRLHLLMAGGAVEAVNVHPSSLRLGPWLLLQFTSDGTRHRLVLGTDNVDAASLATLRRRMVLVDQAVDAVLPGAGDRSGPPGVSPGGGGIRA